MQSVPMPLQSPGWTESKTVTHSNGKQVDVREQIYRAKNEDKQSGSYERYTANDKVVSGERFVERSSGGVGYKDEHTNKTGYTEYYREEKVKTVSYGNSKGSGKNNKAVSNYPKYK